MRNAKSKTAKKAKKKSATGRNGRKVKSLATLREQITDKVTGHAAALVETTIAEADKGHFAAMKYLFEMIGLYPVPSEEEPEVMGESVLAKTLIRRLGLREEAEPSEGIMRTAEVPTAAVPSEDTVE